MITVNIIGLDQLQAKLKDLPNQITKEVNGVLNRGAQLFVRNAQRDAPVNFGILKQGISYKPIPVTGLSVELTSNAFYSPYLEFGTRSRVFIPPEIAKYGATFKSTGEAKTGKGFYDSILEWVKKKGFAALKTKSGKTSKSLESTIAQEQAAFAIYLSIMRHGIKPHPFFFKQLPLAKAEIEKGIAAINKDLQL